MGRTRWSMAGHGFRVKALNNARLKRVFKSGYKKRPMKIFISYTPQDKHYADLMADRIRQAGHEVLYDGWKIKEGDNLIEKINEGVKEADAFVVIISKNSLSSKWSMHEYSVLAFGELSNQTHRIIPVLVDKSTVPQYLARYQYVDLSEDLECGVNEVVHLLSSEHSALSKVDDDRERTYVQAIGALTKALNAGRLTLFCGAGVSIGAGILSWEKLLLLLLESMMERISKEHSLSVEDVDPQEFQRSYSPSALVVGKYLETNLGKDFLPQLRDALYSKNPESCAIIEAIVDLARPQRNGKPLDSIVTFNFDGLIEEDLSENNIRHKAIFEEGMRHGSNELPIYHVHGYLPRKGKISKNTHVVFSEDAYHNQFIDPFSWSNLTQLSKLSQNTCLFIGLSLNDPNLRRLLDVAYRKNPSRELNHYVIKRIPSLSEGTINSLAILLEEQDANELGLNVVWVKEYDQIAPLLLEMSGNVA